MVANEEEDEREDTTKKKYESWKSTRHEGDCESKMIHAHLFIATFQICSRQQSSWKGTGIFHLVHSRCLRQRRIVFPTRSCTVKRCLDSIHVCTGHCATNQCDYQSSRLYLTVTHLLHSPCSWSALATHVGVSPLYFVLLS